MEFILLAPVIGLASISIYYWLVLIAKFFRKETVLESNPNPPQEIGFFLLIASVYFYFFMPVLFGQHARLLQIPIQTKQDEILLTILSHGFYLVIAGWMYLTIYRNRRSPVLTSLETEPPNPFSEDALNKEEIPADSFPEEKQPVDGFTERPNQKSVLEQIELGYNGFIVSFLPVLLVILVTYPFRTEDKLNPLLKAVKNQPGLEMFILAGIMAVVIAPLIEELIFRVIFQGFLITFLRMPAFVAIILTAGLFCWVHGSMDALPILPLALVLGVLYYKTRSYIAVVSTHATFNAFNMMMMGVSLMAEKQGIN